MIENENRVCMLNKQCVDVEDESGIHFDTVCNIKVN
jgi:hypothetical protein